ncbi:MAG TPA: hypothetical protein DEB06_02750 [Phycisphaerales bacterium]|nr:hypothetical protein [Phycisphaerales bacterium]
MLVMVSVCCLVAGAVVLYSALGGGTAPFGDATTLELTGLLGLFVLPWLTLAADRAERRMRRAS